jgi:hypothetical protein
MICDNDNKLICADEEVEQFILPSVAFCVKTYKYV